MPGFFDQFEGGSPSASRDYDAYMYGTDGPAWGPRPAFRPSGSFFGQSGAATPPPMAGQMFGPPRPNWLQRLGQAWAGPPNRPDGAMGPGASWVDPAVVAATTPSPSYTPVTKIGNASDIAARINGMLAPPPTIDSVPDFMAGADSNYRDMIPPPPDYLPPRVPISLAREQQQPRGVFGGLPAGIGSWFGPRRAMGGPIHMMRGGYPELYTRPVREGHFASGGGNQYVRDEGFGDGRSDTVEARLSPGEYVLTGEDVSMIGDGNNEAGARKLDEMRVRLRKHKGKNLAKGKISPNAKDPMEYLAFDGISEGLRRRGKERS